MTGANKHEVGRDDIMAMADYGHERQGRRRAMVALKRQRRLEVGTSCLFHFESYETMWAQIHEMLFVEKGGEAQIADELAAYNPLIPKGRELVATVMFEIDEPERRRALLGKLGGIEETVVVRIGGDTICGCAEADVDRTNSAGKASSVQFIHFPFSDAQVAAFRKPGAEILVGFTHPHYGHMAVMPEDVRETLAGDFD
ncbi:MAG: DUF3501 family protein [Alphaproteobacteria bacterium]